METKRINLSFSMEREEDVKVYKILTEQRHKTDYVIKAVLAMYSEDKSQISKDEIKRAVKEALDEYGVIPVKEKAQGTGISSEQIPDSIFDMFSNL